MPTPAPSKYYLKSLHEEIALFDRKLAHLQRYETFPSEKDRNAAAAKMSVKRGQLVQAARKLVDDGIEFNPSELPRSMNPDGHVPAVSVPEARPVEHTEMAPAQPAARQATSMLSSSPFRDEILEFIAKRKNARQN